MMKRLAVLLLIAAAAAFADAGVLIPSGRQQPEPSMLSLEEMAIDIRVDNGTARVLVRQIFANRTSGVLEGNYIFALPGRAVVSDFAVWDEATRIPGVILERRRAEEIYSNLKWQAIDPGLLQMGERDADEARRTAVFSARIVPIPAWGTKRVEMEYHETVPVEDLKSLLTVPLKPTAYRALTAGRLWITVELHSQHAVKDFSFPSQIYPLAIQQRTANMVKASWEARNVNLAEDFAIAWSLDPGKGEALEAITHRESTAEPGFFEAHALLGAPEAASAGPARTIIALLDTSLSMQWDKLEAGFRALETLLRSLRETDRFNVVMFNDEVAKFAQTPVAASAAEVTKALDFVRAGRLRGGTNLQAALEQGLAQARGNDAYLVVLSDGGATRGPIQSGKLAASYASRWNTIPAAQRPHTYVFAVGDDANVSLGRMLARNDGLLEWVRSTEPVDFKLNAFISKIGRRPVENLSLQAQPAGNFDLVYPLQETAFKGGLAAWVGQYKAPGAATFTVRSAKASVNLPAQNLEHPHLPREWAKARVDTLLEKIEREGEDRATIDEIIRLARKYKFVTPYTSFLAAPRALLRPRLIRPGDPVLRVRTDESVVSVVAMFPFGLVKKLKYLEREDTWQTRFLAPPDMKDGTYSVRLVMRDKQGRVFRESKSFVIASRPPVVKVRLDKARLRRGESVELKVSASETTRTLVARLYGAAPVYLRWNAAAGVNTGQLVVPAHLAAGKYTLAVTAEDFAHNIGREEVQLEVLP